MIPNLGRSVSLDFQPGFFGEERLTENPDSFKSSVREEGKCASFSIARRTAHNTTVHAVNSTYGLGCRLFRDLVLRDNMKMNECLEDFHTKGCRCIQSNMKLPLICTYFAISEVGLQNTKAACNTIVRGDRDMSKNPYKLHKMIYFLHYF